MMHRLKQIACIIKFITYYLNEGLAECVVGTDCVEQIMIALFKGF